MTEQAEVTLEEAMRFCNEAMRNWHKASFDQDGLEDLRVALERHRIQSTAEVTAQRDALAEALDDARHGLAAMTIALEEQEFFTVAARLRAFVERAETALASVKGQEQ